MYRSLLLAGVLFFSCHYPGTVIAQTVSADRVENARKFYKHGLELVEANQLSPAVESFRQALQFDPEFADAYSALGRTYFKLREWQKALDNLNRAAALNTRQREAKEAVPAEVKETAAQNITDKTPETSKDPNLAMPEQTVLGSRVSQPTTPAPEVKEAVPVAVILKPTEETSLTKIYRVGPSDVLDVRLNDAAGAQSTLYTVTAAGLLEHPFFSEPMLVSGLTVEEISDKIQKDLQKRAIIEDPKALVGVRDYASHSVLISGLVKDAGTKFLRREAIPLYVIVADAQPLPEAAKVTVVRGDNQIHEIDLDQAAGMDFLVRAGDVITLRPHATQFVYIGGEIKFPGEKTFRRGLTLMQVILASGGVGPKAKVAVIARNNEDGFLVPTRFNLKEVVSGKAVDPLLKPGDRISVLP